MKYYCRVHFEFEIEDGSRVCFAKGHYTVEKWDNNANTPWLRDGTDPVLREIDHVDIRIQVYTAPNHTFYIDDYEITHTCPEEKFWMLKIKAEIEMAIKEHGDDYNWLEEI